MVSAVMLQAAIKAFDEHLLKNCELPFDAIWEAPPYFCWAVDIPEEFDIPSPLAAPSILCSIPTPQVATEGFDEFLLVSSSPIEVAESLRKLEEHSAANMQMPDNNLWPSPPFVCWADDEPEWLQPVQEEPIDGDLHDEECTRTTCSITRLSPSSHEMPAPPMAVAPDTRIIIGTTNFLQSTSWWTPVPSTSRASSNSSIDAQISSKADQQQCSSLEASSSQVLHLSPGLLETPSCELGASEEGSSAHPSSQRPLQSGQKSVSSKEAIRAFDEHLLSNCDLPVDAIWPTPPYFCWADDIPEMLIFFSEPSSEIQEVNSAIDKESSGPSALDALIAAVVGDSALRSASEGPATPGDCTTGTAQPSVPKATGLGWTRAALSKRVLHQEGKSWWTPFEEMPRSLVPVGHVDRKLAASKVSKECVRALYHEPLSGWTLYTSPQSAQPEV